MTETEVERLRRERDAAVQHARAEEERAGKLYAALADLTSGAMSRGDAWAVLRETDPIEPTVPVCCTAAQPCEQTGREPSDSLAGREQGTSPLGAERLDRERCSECGTTDEACLTRIKTEYRPCCLQCGFRGTHATPPEPIESLVERSSLGTPEARAARESARESVPEETAQAIADRVRNAEQPVDQGLPVALAGAMHHAMRELDRAELRPSTLVAAVMAEYLIARGWPASLRVRDDEGGQE